MIDQNVPHHLCGQAEELRAMLKGDRFLISQTDVDFVHQGSGLQSVGPGLAPQITIGQLAQFVIDERHQLIERGSVTAAPSNQQSRNTLMRSRSRLLHTDFIWRSDEQSQEMKTKNWADVIYTKSPALLHEGR